ncbi:uncharacterized protein LOC130826215 [Amaranthus tricolor]|uniref:uncharacterized protein LOC130826215 n=1 Tax=Amaranthus tricolor TaxID=29722 RepID=UPI00258745A6|nr:uncharacterized protein LOC130826215 [Amaranthus tricolor]
MRSETITDSNENNIKSSAKIRWVSFILEHLGWKLNSSASPATLRILDKYSMPMTKSNGDIGSPCQTPRLALKVSKGLSFKIREYWVEVTYVMILLTNRDGKLRTIIISLRKSKFKVSYALRRSTITITIIFIFISLFYYSTS